MSQSIRSDDSSVRYRRLVRALAARAARAGARDGEAAAQEAVKRALGDPRSRVALEYFFRDEPVADASVPDMTLLQLMAWLHSAVTFVAREERARASTRHEAPVFDGLDAADGSPSQLDHAIAEQHRTLVEQSLSELAREHRTALVMRLGGTKYAEIATSLGVSENTVATWIRRGSIELVRLVRRRLDRDQRVTFERLDHADAKASHV